MDDLEATTERIIARPHQFPALAGMPMRRALMKRFPFMVIFEVRGDVVRVFAVAHRSREPRYWHGRS